MHTCSESLSPFIDSRVNDVLLHTIPDSNEALPQLIDVRRSYTRCCITPQIS